MIRLIAAVDKWNGIAKNGVQPWKLPLDEQYFKQQTLQYDGVVLMGRKTYDVLGHPLPDRHNYVWSRHDRAADGVTVVHDLASFLHEQPDVWVIGGSQLYAASLPFADEIYLTRIEHDFCCDQFFPELPAGHFSLASSSQPQQAGGLTFTYEILKRM